MKKLKAVKITRYNMFSYEMAVVVDDGYWVKYSTVVQLETEVELLEKRLAFKSKEVEMLMEERRKGRFC